MLIYGLWKACDDGIVRPMIECEVLAGDGLIWAPTEFLVDLGADRTVFTADFLATIGSQHLPAAHQLGGVGGAANSVLFATEVRFALHDGQRVVLQGSYAAFTDPVALDTNVLGRDVMNLFAVIADRVGDVICMIARPNRYTIE